MWIDGATNQPGATPTLGAQLGFGPDGSNPAGNAAWTWVDVSFNMDAGNNDEFKASLLPETTGPSTMSTATDDGRPRLALCGPRMTGNGYSPANPGKLTVYRSGDTTAPAVPTGLAGCLRVAGRHQPGVGCSRGTRRSTATRYCERHGRRPLHRSPA